MTTQTKAKLEALGHQIIVLNLPEVANPIKESSVTLTDSTDEAITAALATIRQNHGEIASFIHLQPQFTFQNGNFAQHFQKEKALVKTVFLLAKHLQKNLTELGKTQRANFICVTQLDGALGVAPKGNVSVVGAGLTGLVKSLNLEWPAVFCRVVDVDTALTPSVIAQQIGAEFHDADLATIEVAYNEKGRHTLKSVNTFLADNQKIKTSVTNDSVFLVSGGARGVTATCVIEMAKTFQCKFVLLGRSSVDFELPAYAKNVADDNQLKRLIMDDLKAQGEKPSLAKVKDLFKNIVAKKEVEATLTAIEDHGGKAIYVRGDVTKFSSMQAALKAAEGKLGAFTGIIHGAGRLADKYIQDKTATDFENVLSVKLDGLLSLLQAVDIHHLEHLILFSSVAGFYGNVGQTDYAIANEILSKAAHLFKKNHPNTQVSAINWGAWDGGMVSAALKKKFEEAGVTLVNSEGGAAMLVNELNVAYADQPQVIIGGTLPAAISHLGEDLKTYRIRRNLQVEENPFLMHHVIQGKAVLPVVNAVGWMAQTAERLYPDFRIFKVEDTKLFKGIVFDGKEAKDYIIELKEIAKAADQIVFEACVLTEGAKLPSYFYKAKVTLVPNQAKQTLPKFKQALSPNAVASPGAVLYENGALFHDHYFQGIEQILDFNEKQIVLACKAPKVPLTAQGQFPVKTVNTFFTDIQYQGMVVWVQRFLDGAKSLPLQTDSAIIYKAVPFEQKLFVTVTIEEATEFKMRATCTVYDEAGTVYMQTTGATVTVSKQLTW